MDPSWSKPGGAPPAQARHRSHCQNHPMAQAPRPARRAGPARRRPRRASLLALLLTGLLLAACTSEEPPTAVPASMTPPSAPASATPGVAASATVGSAASITPTPATATAAPGAAGSGLTRHRPGQGGVSVGCPEGWKVEIEQASVQCLHPRGEVIAQLRVSAPGALPPEEPLAQVVTATLRQQFGAAYAEEQLETAPDGSVHVAFHIQETPELRGRAVAQAHAGTFSLLLILGLPTQVEQHAVAIDEIVESYSVEPGVADVPATPAPTTASGARLYQASFGDFQVGCPQDWEIRSGRYSRDDQAVLDVPVVAMYCVEPDNAAALTVRFADVGEELSNKELGAIPAALIEEEVGQRFSEEDRTVQKDGSIRVDYEVEEDEGSPAEVGQALILQRGTVIYMLEVEVVAVQAEDFAELLDELVASFQPPEEPPELEDIIYQDDFSDPYTAWYVGANSEATFERRDGAYGISVLPPGKAHFGTNGAFEIADASVEVELVRAAGPSKNFMAILCRVSSDLRDYYELGIGSDGYYAITKSVDGSYTTLVEAEAGDAAAVEDGPNTLRADCVEDTLTLYVNGKKVAQARDEDLTSGRLALEAATPKEEGNLRVHFDNLVVRQR